MGKGDKKTTKGKRARGSHGNTRPKTGSSAGNSPTAEKQVKEKTEKAPAKKAAVTKATDAKTAAPKAKTATVKKPAAKATDSAAAEKKPAAKKATSTKKADEAEDKE